MGQPRSAPAADPGRRVGVAVFALCLVQFMDVLGVTVVVTSLPAMLASLHAPDSLGSLIATGYAMFFGGLLMLGARLGDRYGHRRTILASLAVFAVGALVAATALTGLRATPSLSATCAAGRTDASSTPMTASTGHFAANAAARRLSAASASRALKISIASIVGQTRSSASRRKW